MDRDAYDIAFHGVRKVFEEGPPVLEHLDLRIAPGEFVSLIGPSGCGKTTILRLASGLVEATSGRVEVDGRNPIAARDGLAYIFQDATLLPWLDVAANVEAPLRLRGMPRARRREIVSSMLELVRLSDVAARYPRQLSGGMRMRVSVARALALEPRLLLLDEPFGALDEMTRNHLNEELLALRGATGWTALFVTHSVAEAVFLSSRILVFAARPGRIHADVPVPFPYPRDASLRSSPHYHALMGGVLRTLREVEERVA